MPLGRSITGSEATMERGHDSRTSAASGSISPCREYASATLGEGGLYIYGAVRPTEDHANTHVDLVYDQDVPAFWLLSSRERDLLGD